MPITRENASLHRSSTQRDSTCGWCFPILTSSWWMSCRTVELQVWMRAMTCTHEFPCMHTQHVVHTCYMRRARPRAQGSIHRQKAPVLLTHDRGGRLAALCVQGGVTPHQASAAGVHDKGAGSGGTQAVHTWEESVLVLSMYERRHGMGATLMCLHTGAARKTYMACIGGHGAHSHSHIHSGWA